MKYFGKEENFSNFQLNYTNFKTTIYLIKFPCDDIRSKVI